MRLHLLRTLPLMLLLSFASCNGVKNEKLDGITPVTAQEEISSFFSEHLLECSSSGSEFNFSQKTECVVVNSLDEFRSMVHSSIPLPSIDFSKYSLILWQIQMANPGFKYDSQSISVDDGSNLLILRLTYKRLQGFFPCTIQYFHHWGLYEKLPDLPVSLMINIVD